MNAGTPTKVTGAELPRNRIDLAVASSATFTPGGPTKMPEVDIYE